MCVSVVPEGGMRVDSKSELSIMCLISGIKEVRELVNHGRFAPHVEEKNDNRFLPRRICISYRASLLIYNFYLTFYSCQR